MEHFKHWPRERVMAAHAEQKTLAAYLLLGELFQRPVHICHVSRKEEILLIRKAKQRGIQVTCEVAPHHLFLTEEDADVMGRGWSEVRPVLNSPMDQQALWDNLDVIDVIATDHAPHTPEEKSSENPPPGFPGLETMLPLLLTAVQEGRLSLDNLIEKTSTNPRKIFRIPEQKETWLEIDQEHKYILNSKDLFTKCGWTPFDGYPVQGYLRRVVLRGETVYRDGEILAAPGTGKNIR
jgi:carbamoyl-phosphate synthase/aspartate carbamoyltransferase/dihydroorotase